jgi:hypothetical protein
VVKPWNSHSRYGSIRVKASADDVAEYGAVGRLVGMECSIRQATEEIAGVETVGGAGAVGFSTALRTQVSAVAMRCAAFAIGSSRILEAVVAEPRAEDHAHEERSRIHRPPDRGAGGWAGIFEQQLQETLRSLAGVLTGDVARLNDRLAAAGISPVVVGPARRRN